MEFTHQTFLATHQTLLENAITAAVAATLDSEPVEPLPFLASALLQPLPPAANAKKKGREYLDSHPEIEQAIAGALTFVVMGRVATPLEAAADYIEHWTSTEAGGDDHGVRLSLDMLLDDDLNDDNYPVRLLLASKIESLHPIPPYELLPLDSFIECPFEDFMETHRHATGVISWRWARPKPLSLKAASTKEGLELVPLSLVQHCAELSKQDTGLKYLWLDWACVPQYPEDPKRTMAEINRSGHYYASSRTMITWCFTSLDEKTLSLAYSTYFTRAWTLSERLHRMGGESPLTVSSFLPLYLQPGSGTCLMDSAAATKLNRLIGDANGEMRMMVWHRTVGLLIEKVKESMEARRRGVTDKVVPLTEEFMELVLSRYPRLQQVQSIVRDHLSKLADPITTERLRIAVLLRGYGEWLRPCPEEEGLYRMKASMVYEMYDVPPGKNGFPYSTKLMMVANWLQDGRKKLDNMNALTALQHSADTSTLLSDAHMVAAEAVSASEAAEGLDVARKAVAAQRLVDMSAQMWALAATRPMSEAVDAGWLAKYLVFEVGVTYVAFEPRDLLFAIKDLFHVPAVASYEEAPHVWSQLAHIAGIEHGGPYSWIRNLSRPGPTLALTTCHKVFTRTRSPTVLQQSLSGCSASQFGVFTLDSADQRIASPPVTKELSFVPALTLADPGGKREAWLTKDDDDLASFFVGAKLRCTTLDKLGAGTLKLQALDLSSDEIPLSLRGRAALQELEARLHSTLRDVALAAGGINGARSLFITARHHAGGSHLRVLILCCVTDGSGAWCPIAIGSVGGAPQKGGTWGVRQMMSNLATSLRRAAGGDANNVGTASIIGARCLDDGDDGFVGTGGCEGQAQGWWEWPISLSGLLPEGEAEEEEEEVEAVGGSGDDTVDDFIDVLRAFKPGSPTACSDADLRVLRACFRFCKETGVNSQSCGLYGSVMASNRMMDSDMAKKLSYFAQYAALLAEHIGEVPAIGKSSSCSRRLDNFVEDLGDAIGMATAAEKQAHGLAAQQALASLTAVCEAAGIL